MASSRANIHVIRKDNIAEHTTVSLSYDAQFELEDGSILARPILVSLTANNLSYAHAGTVLHWWDSYPVPSDLPAPYNDQSQYGVVPAWGYGEVLQSRASGLENGDVLFGFWPTHDLPVVLRLASAGMKGQWIEQSPGRVNLMNIYQRYLGTGLKVEGVKGERLEAMAWHAVFIVYEAGWFINRFIFGTPSIHPLGTGNWSERDADLSQAVVISLSASGKTARAFQDSIVNDRKSGSGPLGLLGVTASQDQNLLPKAAFPTKLVGYRDVTSGGTLEWIKALKPKRVIVVDFASRGTSLDDLVTALESRITTASTTIIGVGGESKAHSPEELSARAQKQANMPNRVQMNTSPLRDRAMELLGTDAFFDERQRAWDGFVERGNLKGMKLEWGEGVEGEKGIEGGWQKLCDQSVPSDVGLIFKM